MENKTNKPLSGKYAELNPNDEKRIAGGTTGDPDPKHEIKLTVKPADNSSVEFGQDEREA